MRLSLCDSYRNNVYIKPALATLLFAPFGELWVSGRNEAKAGGRIGRIRQLDVGQLCAKQPVHDYSQWSAASSSLA